ncbi:MAG: Cas9 inhibitor AcrIIA9 family protein [Lysinibacillus sp.]
MQQAIEKINAEMAQSNNPYVQVIGQFLLTQITTKEAAEKVLEATKTVENSLNAMQKEAKKKAVNGMAMLTDEEGYAIVLAYFGLEQDTQPQKAPKANVKVKPAKQKQTKKKDKVVNFPGNEFVQTSFDDFLGEQL